MTPTIAASSSRKRTVGAVARTKPCPYCGRAELELTKGKDYHCFSKGVTFRWDGKRWRRKARA